MCLAVSAVQGVPSGSLVPSASCRQAGGAAFFRWPGSAGVSGIHLRSQPSPAGARCWLATGYSVPLPFALLAAPMLGVVGLGLWHPCRGVGARRWLHRRQPGLGWSVVSAGVRSPPRAHAGSPRHAVAVCSPPLPGQGVLWLLRRRLRCSACAAGTCRQSRPRRVCWRCGGVLVGAVRHSACAVCIRRLPWPRRMWQPSLAQVSSALRAICGAVAWAGCLGAGGASWARVLVDHCCLSQRLQRRVGA